MKTLIIRTPSATLAALSVYLALPAVAHAISGPSDVQRGGALTATSQNVLLRLEGLHGAAFNVTGTWVGTIRAQVSVDNANWVAAELYNPATGVISANTTANGTFIVLGTTGMHSVRVNFSAYTSGTANIYTRASNGSNPISFGGTSGSQPHDDAVIATNNPVLAGGVADTTLPTAVADADVARLLTNTYGAVSVFGGPRHDAVNDADYGPVKLGAVAKAEGAALGAVSAADDVTDLKADLNGRLFVRTDHPRGFTCNVNAATVETECQALVASNKLYITDVVLSKIATGTAGTTLVITKGTGTNCGTGNGTLLGVYYVAANTTTVLHFHQPAATAAGEAVCCKPSAAEAFSCNISGWIAP